MMTPEQQRQLIADSLKHERREEPLEPDLARWGIFSYEDLTEHLFSQANIDEATGRSLEERAKRYIKHVISLPDGASQLREKYGLDLSNAPEDHPRPTV